jgi:hypothetical protein
MFLNLVLFILIAIYNVNAQTVAAVAPCPSGYNSYCKNSGYCVILFGTYILLQYDIQLPWKHLQNFLIYIYL